MKSQELSWNDYEEYYNMVSGNTPIEERYKWRHPHDWQANVVPQPVHLAIGWGRLGSLRAAVGGAYRRAKELSTKPGMDHAFHLEHMGVLSEIYWTVLGGEMGDDYGMPVDCHHKRELP